MHGPFSIHVSEAVRTYFGGERREMHAILGGSLAAVLLAAGLLALLRDSFAKGFGATVLAFALLLTGMAGSLLVRDRGHHALLLADVASAKAADIVAVESERIAVVLSKYNAYRLTSLVLCLVALAAALALRQGWVHGLAVGVLLFAAAQLTIDHYSEARARHYAKQLLKH